jgi:N-acetylglucosaminyldiphosphoundecaprenol N-acetyl-beta-D-mannosaminyltransferase
MSLKILGVKLDCKTEIETIKFMEEWLGGSEQKLIATVNPEFLVASQSNLAFKKLLNETSLNTCDGFGIQLIGKLFYKTLIPRVTGVDLTEKLLTREDDKFKIYLLGSSKEVLKEIKSKFNHNLVGTDDGGKMLGNNQLESNHVTIEKIKSSSANTLLVAFNQVQQETWLKNNLPLIPNIKIAIGVGGTFDFLSGKINRAPSWLRRIGLEWLYRLIQEPQRLKRIWRATIVFSWLTLKEKIIN